MTDTILSINRISDYLYKIRFSSLPADTNLQIPFSGACTSFIRDGKLYRNLDWSYSNDIEFWVETPSFKGMSLIPGLDSSNMDDHSLLEQLPYHINDGVNRNGIMVSSHILFDDFNHRYSGTTNLTSLPFLVLSLVDSMSRLESIMEPFLEDIFIPDALFNEEYLMQFLVSDGTTTKVITPSETGYSIVDITSNPKITNFKWVPDKIIVSRTDEDIQLRPTGIERWNMVEDHSVSLEDLRFTVAYDSDSRLSEYIGYKVGVDKYSTDEELMEIFQYVKSKYPSRKRDSKFWQTLHSAIYSPKGLESLYIQEDYTLDYAARLNSRPSITEIVTGILNSVTGLTTIYDTSFSANVRLDRLQGPFAITYFVKELQVETNSYTESADFEIFFCDRTDLQAKGEVLLPVVDAMKEKALEFVSMLKSEKQIEILWPLKIKTAIGRYDANVTGVSVEFKVKERQGRCL